MKRFLFTMFLLAHASPGVEERCETAENLRTGDGEQEYYLRYVENVKYDKKIAFTDQENDPQKGLYISFDKKPQETNIGTKILEAKRNVKKTSSDKKFIDNVAIFTIEGSKNDTQGFKIVSRFDTNRRVMTMSHFPFFKALFLGLHPLPKMSLYYTEDDHYTQYFDYKLETGTLVGALPLATSFIPKRAFVCFQKVEFFKEKKTDPKPKTCSFKSLLAPNSTFVNKCDERQAIATGSSCKVGCKEKEGYEEKTYTCQKSGSWNYETEEFLQPFKVSCNPKKDPAIFDTKKFAHLLTVKNWFNNLNLYRSLLVFSQMFLFFINPDAYLQIGTLILCFGGLGAILVHMYFGAILTFKSDASNQMLQNYQNS